MFKMSFAVFRMFPVLCVELLRTHKLSHRSVHVQPRGLMNRGNWCYVNAVSLL